MQLGIGDVRIDHRDAARQAARLGDTVQRRIIISAVTARLHDDVARKAEMVA
ncbi:formyltetrahydrofolate hydrolase [Sphingomonas sp. UYEF23]